MFAELFSEEATVYLLKRQQQTGPFKEMLLFVGSERRMIWEHVRFPFLDDWQIATSFDFLQQTIHKPGELPKRQIATIGTPRLQFSEVSCN